MSIVIGRFSVRTYRTTIRPYAGVGLHIHWRTKGQDAALRSGASSGRGDRRAA